MIGNEGSAGAIIRRGGDSVKMRKEAFQAKVEIISSLSEQDEPASSVETGPAGSFDNGSEAFPSNPAEEDDRTVPAGLFRGNIPVAGRTP